MQGFTLGLHIAVKDFLDICNKLDRKMTNWSLSDHCWVHNWNRANVDVINQYTWRNINQDMVDEFYQRYKNELNKFDFFYIFYPPVFSLLFRKFDKPIIMHIPMRFDMPFMGNVEKWQWLIHELRDGIDDGQIIPLANDKLDQQYFKNYVNREINLISGLCDYTSLNYIGDREEFLYCSKFKEFRNWVPNISLVDKVSGHSWESLTHFKALVHIPYVNLFISLVEQYSMNIPLLFPSHDFLVTLWERYKNSGVMTELSHRKIFGLTPGTPKEIKFDGIDLNDYNNIESFKYWSSLSDFYDPEIMPYIEYFESVSELEFKLNTLNFSEISDKIRQYNILRKQKILNQWKEVLDKIS